MGVDTLDFSASSEELNLNLDGWEGPLDLLLNLARAQKVDLAQISILQLVDQYTDYIGNARALKLEIAADYLVMAAWLAYLKSCLLLPKDPEQDPSPEEVALRLQMRLQRLDAMREAGARLLGGISPERVRSTQLAGENIENILSKAPGNGAPIGGLKVVAQCGWFAARPSGTEDIYKIYAESFRGPEHLKRIIDEAQAIVTDALAA